MADKLFGIDTKNVKKLEQFAKRSPRLFQRAYGMTLNNLAFAIKPEIPKALDKEYEIRSPRFVSSSIRVQKSKLSGPMQKQGAIVGSIKRPRFSGWSEPVTGKSRQQDNQPTVESRKGNYKRKVTPSSRFKTTNTFRKPSEFRGRSTYQKNIVMINTLKRQRYRKPFLIKGHKYIKPGLYVFRSGDRLRMLQSTDPRSSKVKRYDWPSESIKITSRSFKTQRAWENNINRVLPKRL